MPAQGWRASLSLVLVALPLLIPWNVVGTIWQIFGRGDIGLMGKPLMMRASRTTTPVIHGMPG
jgi:glycerol transport system permease protein